MSKAALIRYTVKHDRNNDVFEYGQDLCDLVKVTFETTGNLPIVGDYLVLYVGRGGTIDYKIIRREFYTESGNDILNVFYCVEIWR